MAEKSSVGRIVHVFGTQTASLGADDPIAGIITFVHDDGDANLTVFIPFKELDGDTMKLSKAPYAPTAEIAAKMERAWIYAPQ